MVKKTKNTKFTGPVKGKRQFKGQNFVTPVEKEAASENGEELNDDDHDNGFDDMKDIPFDDLAADNSTEQGDATAVLDVEGETLGQSQTTSAKFNRKGVRKPLTADELNSLKETENLFHSNIFKLQIEELLSEVRFKQGRKSAVERWFASFKTVVSTLDSSESQPLDQVSSFKGIGVKIPYFLHQEDPKTLFRFIAPTTIVIGGSHALDCATGLNSSIDIRVEIPRDCLKNIDNLNFRYLRKRAFYLATLAGHLKNETDVVGGLQYGCLSGDVARPYLLINPAGKLKDKVLFRILLVPPPDFFEAKRFLTSKNNIRTKWITGKEVAEGKEPPTPHYNSLVLSEILAPDIEAFRAAKLRDANVLQAICLLRVWLKQRELDQGLGGFTPFIMSMYLVYLIQEKKIKSSMSSYQIMRTALLSLAQADWIKEGISLSLRASSVPLSEFHQHFEVVFVDHSSQLNLCAHMSRTTFQRANWEASIAIGLLSTNYRQAFEALFMTPKPFLLTYDHSFKLPQATLKKINPDPIKVADFATHVPSAVGNTILQVLVQALNQRARLVALKLEANPVWKIGEHVQHSHDLEIGLVLDAREAASLLDKGPLADSPHASEFRQFWGKKSELRRFQDGTVAEAVVWAASNYAERRTIVQQIVYYILQQHFQVTPEEYHYVAHQLETLILFPILDNHFNLYGTGEEMEIAAVRVTDELGKQLRKLENLPLAVTAVQGIAPVFRNADVFPHIPSLPRGPNRSRTIEGNRSIPLPDTKVTPTYVKYHELLVTLETSNKWPEDYEAVLRVKSAFYLQLAVQLKNQFNLNTIPHYTHVDVFKDGYVFRTSVAYPREVALLKRQMVDGVVQIKDTDASMLLNRRIVLLPQMTGALHGLHQQQPAYSAAVRLAIRWVSCHMLLPYIPEIVVELIVASLFVDPGLYAIPLPIPETGKALWTPTLETVGTCTPQTAFLRFLNFLVRMDWKMTPIIVNFDNSLTSDDIGAIEEHFHKNRTTLPPVFIATPYDHSGVAFTKERPSLPVLARLVALAGESLRLLQSQFHSKAADLKQCFRPPLDPYDVIIHLKPLMVGRRNEGIDADSGSKTQLREIPKSDDPFPVYDFEPVDCYLKQLKACYGELARFFHDRHGGLVIGVLWIKKAFEPLDFKTGRVHGRELQGNKLVPNIPAILTDFGLFGEGLVRAIETKTDKWDID